MYFVDRKKIETILTYMEELTTTFSELKQVDTRIKKLALERMAQGWIEAVTDTGNQVIDGFIMRDPGSYEDIIDIMEDENVVPEEEGEGLKRMISWRKVLIQEYDAVDTAELHEALLQNKEAVENFPGRVRRFLEHELGPISAFLPEEEG